MGDLVPKLSAFKVRGIWSFALRIAADTGLALKACAV